MLVMKKTYFKYTKENFFFKTLKPGTLVIHLQLFTSYFMVNMTVCIRKNNHKKKKLLV